MRMVKFIIANFMDAFRKYLAAKNPISTLPLGGDLGTSPPFESCKEEVPKVELLTIDKALPGR